MVHSSPNITAINRTGCCVLQEMPSLEAMETFGKRIAAKLREGDVVALNGPLGAGKTTLARAILRKLGVSKEIPSPTFTIIEIYDDICPSIVHADFYRLEDPQEALELGLSEYREDAVLIAEWPEHIGGFSHEPQCLDIKLEILGQKRRAIVEGGLDWLDRMP